MQKFSPGEPIDWRQHLVKARNFQGLFATWSADRGVAPKTNPAAEEIAIIVEADDVSRYAVRGAHTSVAEDVTWLIQFASRDTAGRKGIAQ